MADYTEEQRVTIRKAGSLCVWCGEVMDHNCGAGACGGCCGDLGMIAHESPRGYKWLTETVLRHVGPLAERKEG